jgi:tetratricopeptide (TPR) repeat protein
MQLFRVELFAHQTQSPKLRLFGPDGKQVAERTLPEDSAEWVQQTMAEYSKPSPNLNQIGRKLYEWLDDSAHRWFSKMDAATAGLSLHLQFQSDLQNLPWELMSDHAAPLCGQANRRFALVRRVGDSSTQISTANRPLRVLFMASSPQNTEPVLAFEDEERIILDATGKQPLELVVEESGSLNGLRERLEWAGPGFFDVIHLTGHADLLDIGPRMLMEDDVGERKDASANDIANALRGYWPRLLFLSGCKTGMAGANQAFPSLADDLVTAGAPAVLAWGQPVGDNAASLLAGHLYHGLAIGWPIDEAVALARFELYLAKLSAWHQLRMYADATSVAPIVTVPSSPDRLPLRVRSATDEFLDAGAQTKICSRDQFVGRRRLIQRSLKTLRSVQGNADYSEGLILHGMGGLGKSSTAARLCERMSGFDRFVWVGRLDEAQLLRVFGDRIEDAGAIAELNETRLPLSTRLKKLLQGYLLTRPALFVFDDFEQNAELDEEQHPRFDHQQCMLVNPGASSIMEALRKAIRESNTQSRLVVTCRYDLPGFPQLHREPLDGLKQAELDKKLKRLGAFAERVDDDPIRKRAVELSGGNPRLLEQLNCILADEQTDREKIFHAMEQTTEEFREGVLLRALLDQQHPDARRLLARLSIFRLPVREGVAAQLAGAAELQPHFDRLVRVGLLEKIPARSQYEYLVPSLVEPLLSAELTEQLWQEAYWTGTAALNAGWQIGEQSLLKGFELHRLSLLAKNAEIAATVGHQIATNLISTSRFREALLLCEFTRSLTEDFRIVHTQARAEQALGQTDVARDHYEHALATCPAIDLSDNDVQGLRAAIVHNLANLCNQQGDVDRAMTLWQESLDLKDKIGDVQGKAATLNNMARVIAQQGDVDRAMKLWQESLGIEERIGNVKGKAATLANMAGVIAQQGDVDRAMKLWQESLKLKDTIGDVQGKAATLHNMAGVIAQQGDVDRAMKLWQESLEILDKIGDVKGKAATLNNMAGVIAKQGDVDRAMKLWQESLELKDKIGDVQGKAATLANMAWAAGQNGDRVRKLELNFQAARALADVRAWPDLIIVLGNLGSSESPQAICFLAQALWLLLRTTAPIDDSVVIAARLLQKIGTDSEHGPYVAAAAVYFAATRGEAHPKKDELQNLAFRMLLACAQARNLTQEQLETWLSSEGLLDSSRWHPRLEGSLANLVGDEKNWLFDRSVFR